MIKSKPRRVRVTTKCCKECGRIQENTILLVNKLLTKIKDRLYFWQYNDVLDVRGKSPRALELFEWQQDLEKIIKELNYDDR